MVNRVLLALCCASSLMFTVGDAIAAQDADADTLQAQIEQLKKENQAQMDALQQRLERLQQKVDQAATSPVAASAPSQTANGFNPAISLILAGQLASFSETPDDYTLPGFALGDEAGPGSEGLSLSETELTLSANVDDWLFGQVVLAVSPENEIGVEEAYLQTLALPEGFGVRFGRMKSGLGYFNGQHSHTWDFIDTPLVYRALLNNQFADDGVRVTWLAPTDVFMEVGAEVFSGGNYPASGNAHNGSGGAYTAYANFGGDVGISHSWLAGLSRLSAQARARDSGALGSFTGESHVNVINGVWKWAPNGNGYDTNFKLQAEYLWGDERGNYDAVGEVDSKRQGWYAQAIYQFMPRWRLGARFDRVSSAGESEDFVGTALDSSVANPRRASVMVDFAHSEFSRFRLQFNRDLSGAQASNQVFLQYVMAMGAHGGHAY